MSTDETCTGLLPGAIIVSGQSTQGRQPQGARWEEGGRRLAGQRGGDACKALQ